MNGISRRRFLGSAAVVASTGAIDRVLNAYERVQKDWSGENPRFRIEPCSLVNPSILKLIRNAGVVPAPFYTYAHYRGNKRLEYGEESIKGSLIPGKLADIVVLEKDPHDVDPDRIADIKVLQTILGRRSTFET